MSLNGRINWLAKSFGAYLTHVKKQQEGGKSDTSGTKDNGFIKCPTNHSCLAACIKYKSMALHAKIVVGSWLGHSGFSA